MLVGLNFKCAETLQTKSALGKKETARDIEPGLFLFRRCASYQAQVITPLTI